MRTSTSEEISDLTRYSLNLSSRERHMPVKRELWKEPLSKSYVPNWHCPLCAGGYLKQKPDSLHFWETGESRKAHEHEAWDPEWIDYRFSVLLVCNNERCQEPVAVTGNGKVDLVQTSNEGDAEYIEFFYPKYVSPAPPLIAVSPDYPEEVASELSRSFIAAWSDFSSAGNHIRAAVERLLDHLKEPKTKLGKAGKRERLSLHTRIGSLSHRDKDLSDSLLAVKWLGNAGSHTDELTQDDIFDALDILDVILDDLFVRHRARVKKLVTAINKNKGPAKK